MADGLRPQPPGPTDYPAPDISQGACLVRLLISGGGSGGHVSAALAVAQAFRDEHPDGEVLLVGRRGGLEERLVPDARFALETISVRGYDRDARWRNLALPHTLPPALVRGLRLLDRFEPDVVLGVGAHAMVPCLTASLARGVPYVLQVSEHTGLANRMFRSRAAAACVSFPEDVHRFPTRRTVFTGFPLRPGFERRRPAVPPRRLLIMGGGGGARRLNHAVWGALDGLLARFEEVLHHTGAQGAARAAVLARPGYRPIEFAPDMARLLGEADLVVCRAGVGTCAEVTAVGLPAIMVPGRFGGSHQGANADVLVRAGAARLVDDADLDPARLLAELERLTPDDLGAMAGASASLGRRDGARQIVRVLEEEAERAGGRMPVRPAGSRVPGIVGQDQRGVQQLRREAER